MMGGCSHEVGRRGIEDGIKKVSEVANWGIRGCGRGADIQLLNHCVNRPLRT